jgi:hypothetical protein
VGSGFSNGKLCGVHNGSVHCHGGDGSFGQGVSALHEDSEGNLWARVLDGLWNWKPSPPKFYSLPGDPPGTQSLSEDADGALLVGWNGRIYRFVDGKTEAAAGNPCQIAATSSMLRRKNIYLWRTSSTTITSLDSLEVASVRSAATRHDGTDRRCGSKFPYEPNTPEWARQRRHALLIKSGSQPPNSPRTRAPHGASAEVRGAEVAGPIKVPQRVSRRLKEPSITPEFNELRCSLSRQRSRDLAPSSPPLNQRRSSVWWHSDNPRNNLRVLAGY